MTCPRVQQLAAVAAGTLLATDDLPKPLLGLSQHRARRVPARSSSPRDICPHTGRPRLRYDRARVLRGLTQRELGKLLGVHQVHASGIQLDALARLRETFIASDTSASVVDGANISPPGRVLTEVQIREP
jgi:hypothetical protein